SSSSSSSPSAAWSISIATSCFASSSEPSSSSGLSLSHSNSVMGTPRTLAMIATSESSPAFASFTNSSSVATMALSRSSVRFFTTSMTDFFSLASDIFFVLRTLHERELFPPGDYSEQTFRHVVFKQRGGPDVPQEHFQRLVPALALDGL